jgi:hypothetical protein
MVSRVGSVFVLVLLATGFTSTVTLGRAHAYIDAGSGTFFLQILLASVFGSLFMLKVFWRRLVTRISRMAGIVKGAKIHRE